MHGGSNKVCSCQNNSADGEKLLCFISLSADEDTLLCFLACSSVVLCIALCECREEFLSLLQLVLISQTLFVSFIIGSCTAGVEPIASVGRYIKLMDFGSENIVTYQIAYQIIRYDW